MTFYLQPSHSRIQAMKQRQNEGSKALDWKNKDTNFSVEQFSSSLTIVAILKFEIGALSSSQPISVQHDKKLYAFYFTKLISFILQMRAFIMRL